MIGIKVTVAALASCVVFGATQQREGGVGRLSSGLALAASLSVREVEGRRRRLVLRVGSQGHGGADGSGEGRADGGLLVGVALRRRLLLRLGGGGRGLGALTGAAAGLCAGTRLFHLPPLG